MRRPGRVVDTGALRAGDARGGRERAAEEVAMKNNSQPAGALLLSASLWCGVAAAQVGPSPRNITPPRSPSGTPPSAPQPQPNTLHQEVRAWVRKTLIKTPAARPLTFASRPNPAALAADRSQAAAKRAALVAARKQAA